MNISPVFFGLLFLAGVGLLCCWSGRKLLQEGTINPDAGGSAGCFFTMALLLFSAVIGGIALLVIPH